MKKNLTLQTKLTLTGGITIALSCIILSSISVYALYTQAQKSTSQRMEAVALTQASEIARKLEDAFGVARTAAQQLQAQGPDGPLKLSRTR